MSAYDQLTKEQKQQARALGYSDGFATPKDLQHFVERYVEAMEPAQRFIGYMVAQCTANYYAVMIARDFQPKTKKGGHNVA